MFYHKSESSDLLYNYISCFFLWFFSKCSSIQGLDKETETPGGYSRKQVKWHTGSKNGGNFQSMQEDIATHSLSITYRFCSRVSLHQRCSVAHACPIDKTPVGVTDIYMCVLYRYFFYAIMYIYNKKKNHIGYLSFLAMWKRND